MCKNDYLILNVVYTGDDDDDDDETKTTYKLTIQMILIFLYIANSLMNGQQQLCISSCCHRCCLYMTIQ